MSEMARECAWKAGEVPSDVIDYFEWEFEKVLLKDLEGMQFSSCCLVGHVHVFTKSSWETWLAGEIEMAPERYERIMDDWSPADPEDMAISFQEDADGDTYLAIWDGHHRFAVAALKGIEAITMAVGRRK